MTIYTYECGGISDFSPQQVQIIKSIAKLFGMPKQEIGIDAFIVDSDALVLEDPQALPPPTEEEEISPPHLQWSTLLDKISSPTRVL